MGVGEMVGRGGRLLNFEIQLCSTLTSVGEMVGAHEAKDVGFSQAVLNAYQRRRNGRRNWNCNLMRLSSAQRLPASEKWSASSCSRPKFKYACSTLTSVGEMVGLAKRNHYPLRPACSTLTSVGEMVGWERSIGSLGCIRAQRLPASEKWSDLGADSWLIKGTCSTLTSVGEMVGSPSSFAAL